MLNLQYELFSTTDSGKLVHYCVVGAVSMDLSKAFDMIPHDLLLAKLAAYDVAPMSLPLLHSYSVLGYIEDVTSDVVVFSKGVPQGSVLGPLLFNIFINDLFYFINRANFSNYADDNQIYFSDRDPEVVKSVINGDLAVAKRWFDDNCQRASRASSAENSAARRMAYAKKFSIEL